MKATALIAAGLLAVGTAAIANTSDTAKSDDHARVEQKDHRTVGEKLRSAMHRMGEKTRHALHRDRNDTTAMGASGSTDGSSARQRRMDDAYANWQAKHDKQEKSR